MYGHVRKGGGNKSATRTGFFLFWNVKICILEGFVLFCNYFWIYWFSYPQIIQTKNMVLLATSLCYTWGGGRNFGIFWWHLLLPKLAGFLLQCYDFRSMYCYRFLIHIVYCMHYILGTQKPQGLPYCSSQT